MYRNNSNGNGASRALGFMALCVMLAMGLASMASPAEAAPFAYVANSEADSVSVVVATGPLGLRSLAISLFTGKLLSAPQLSSGELRCCTEPISLIMRLTKY
jgi:hypothetical protein